jgi:hypothetical protein
MTRQIRGLIRFSMRLLVGLALMTSCGGDLAQEQGIGELEITLQSTGPSGALFRLVDACFELVGPSYPTPGTVCTGDFADSETLITLPLAAGTYQVTLQDGWHLEQAADAQPFTQIDAQLISPNPASITVRSNQVVGITFSFLVDGALVGVGTLGLNFGVEDYAGAGGPVTATVRCVCDPAMFSIWLCASLDTSRSPCTGPNPINDPVVEAICDAVCPAHGGTPRGSACYYEGAPSGDLSPIDCFAE